MSGIRVNAKTGEVVTFSATSPVLTLEEAKRLKREELQEEGLSRIQVYMSAIHTMDQLDHVREFWLSIAPAARQPTPTFQGAIDVYQAGKAAIAVIDGYTTIAEVEAYDVVTDPAWPV